MNFKSLGGLYWLLYIEDHFIQNLSKEPSASFINFI